MTNFNIKFMQCSNFRLRNTLLLALVAFYPVRLVPFEDINVGSVETPDGFDKESVRIRIIGMFFSNFQVTQYYSLIDY